jgi:Domain of unknown function (DUF5916)
MRLLILFIFLSSLLLFAGQPDASVKLLPFVTAVRTTGHITIDGILNEAVWQGTPSVNLFIQRDPVEGVEPSQKTVVYVAYDDDAIYFAARMFDSHPDSIIARLTRRDNYIASDYLIFGLDPYRDKRSGYFFQINAAGTLSDGVLYNDDWSDNSWDAVWEGKACIDDKGWTVEIRIPFSQIGFKNDDHQVWGINIKRFIARNNEEDYIVKIPKNEGAGVSRFIDLVGLDGIKPSGKIEVLPYVTGKAEYLQHSPGDPFNTGSKYTPGIGADIKMGVGSNLTLNATLNPDFGQVEIDPAVINLSDVETYYAEKRPFFIQGSSVFDFGNGGARNYWGFNWPGPSLFYSRRIGRNPQGSVPDTADFSSMPSGTHIIGAAKLTGKVGDNWNIGTIQAITRREFADYEMNGIKSEAEVEPLTYYGIARLQKEINNGRQGIGIIATYTARDYLNQSLSDITNKNSFTGGIDGWTSFDTSKTWVLTGSTSISYIHGSTQRLIDLQENSQHYFQRPDAINLHVDSNKTSLTGFLGRFYLVKQQGNSFFNSAFGFITPGFDCNDLGYLSRADVINMHIGGGYDWTKPTDYFRYLELGIAFFRNYDFDMNKTNDGIFQFGTYQLLNYYSIGWNLAYNPWLVNNTRTRGGPLTLNPPGWQANISLSSDDRKNIVYSFSANSYQADYGNSLEYDLSVEYRPASNISLSISPFISREFQRSMYVGIFTDNSAVNTFSNRYVFGELDQKTIGAGIRLNWTFTPNLTLQLYVQPLISTGKYTSIKELAKPRSYEFNTYSNISLNESDNIYTVVPDGSGTPFTFDNPDFNIRSLRGNAVLRWEYLPGSVLYLVWTQTRSDNESIGDNRLLKSFSGLTDIRPDNIFALKFTYWFNI